MLPMIYGESYKTKIAFELTNIEGVKNIDNLDGESVKATIHRNDGSVVVSRDVPSFIYEPGDTIVMKGTNYSLEYDTQYTYNLSTVYGNLYYGFTTPPPPLPLAQSDNARIFFDIISISGGNPLNNIDGSLSTLVNNGASTIVSRSAEDFSYDDGDTVVMEGSYFNMGCDTTYTYELDTSVGSFYYDFVALDCPGRFVDNGDGTVTDTEEWVDYEKDSGPRLEWEEALAHCQELCFAGHCDWYLDDVPIDWECTEDNYHELSHCVDPGLNNAFDWCPNNYDNNCWYWTGREDWQWDFNAMGYFVGGPYAEGQSKGHEFYVRCKRDR